MLKKMLAISLSLIMLISSTGISLATHFCMGHAVESRLSLGKAELDCGMEITQSCDHQTQFNRIPCCENEYQAINHDENFSISTLLVNFEVSPQVGIFQSFNWQLNFDNHTFAVNPFYSPPLLAQEIPILYQSFLL